MNMINKAKSTQLGSDLVLEMTLGTLLHPFSLQQLDFKLSLDGQGKPRETRTVILQIAQEGLSIFPQRCLSFTLPYLNGLLIMQVRLEPRPEGTGVRGITQVQETNAANVGGVHMIEHQCHLFLSAAQGKEAQEETECR